MKDKFDNELNIGDTVYFASSSYDGHGYEINRGIIIGFPKPLDGGYDRVTIEDTWGKHHVTVYKVGKCGNN